MVRMLQESSPEDPFAKWANPYLDQEEVTTLMVRVGWRPADASLARKIGQLITAAGSLVHGLYNDVVTDYGWDGYGPYQVSLNHKVYTLLIRHFPDLRPNEIWGKEYLPTAREVVIYSLYQGVTWEIAFVGCHTLVTAGKPIDGLKLWAVEIDGREAVPEDIDKLIAECVEKAEVIYRQIRRMDFEELKRLVMLQECFQFNILSTAAQVDWRPTPEMYARITGTPLLQGIVPHGKMISRLDEYREALGINQFTREVLG